MTDLERELERLRAENDTLRERLSRASYIWEHGTVNGYVNRRCRCDLCKAAGSEHNRENRIRRAQEQSAR